MSEERYDKAYAEPGLARCGPTGGGPAVETAPKGLPATKPAYAGSGAARDGAKDRHDRLGGLSSPRRRTSWPQALRRGFNRRSNRRPNHWPAREISGRADGLRGGAPLACAFTRRAAPRRAFLRRVAFLPILVGALALLLAGCAVPGTIHGSGTLTPVTSATPTTAPLPPVRFPQDEAPHQDLTEWWYYTGHFHGVDAQGQTHTYGFELTFFQTLRDGVPPYYAAHYAISDITRGQFHYHDVANFVSPSVVPAPGSTGGFNLTLGGWTAKGLNGHDQLNASMTGYAINLTLTDQLPAPILHGGNGIISYGAAGYSYYYSRPLMAIQGSVADHGATIAVTGQAWMDHQWGNFLSTVGAGWDWYSIQLSNRTEYMLYIIRDSQKRPISVFGTAVATDGSAHQVSSLAIHSQATGSWRSPVTGGVYPSGWVVTLTGATPLETFTLTLTPLLQDQELVTTNTTGVAYWEGAVNIQGTAAGQATTGEGYVELTGYAQVPSGAQGPVVP